MKSPRIILATGLAILLIPSAYAQRDKPTTEASRAPVQMTDLCRIIEGLPGEKAPIRKSKSFRKVIRSMGADIRATAGGRTLDAKRATRHLTALEKALSKTLESAREAFHLEAEERWSRSHQSRAKRFLKTHVFTRNAPLRVGEFGFEPSPSLRAVLLWSACWAKDADRVIAYGRGATHPDEGSARALAALTLNRLDRGSEAQELLELLNGEGFLVAYAQSKLVKEKDRRRRQRALARRRATTNWQRTAVGLEPAASDRSN